MGALSTFLFVPNIIDYFRILCLFTSILYCQKNPVITVFCYGFSQTLDAFDGMAARTLGQCNEFGKVLDQVIDRASDAVILAILSSLYIHYNYVFLIALALDLISHWYQVYSTLYCQEDHHKTAKTEWKLLEIYYTWKGVLFTMVFGYEHFEKQWLSSELISINNACLYFSTPIFLIKNIISVVQLISASTKIVKKEQELKKIKK